MADFIASRHSVLGNVVGGGVHGYAFGRIFGNAAAGGLYGALNGLESSIQQMGTALYSASQATLAARKHLELLDMCLMGFFVQLDRNAEKLFDWAGSNTFGGSVDLSLVHSTAKEANELLAAAVIPILNKLSIISAVREVEDEQAQLQREQQKRDQEETDARSWVDNLLRWTTKSSTGRSRKRLPHPVPTAREQFPEAAAQLPDARQSRQYPDLRSDGVRAGSRCERLLLAPTRTVFPVVLRAS